jgi:hypothetical protein
LLWGIGLLNVYHLSSALSPIARAIAGRSVKWIMLASFLVIPLGAFIYSLPRLATVDWQGRLDVHFMAGIMVALGLLLTKSDLAETFTLFISGMLLGFVYEYLGTSIGEWTYITGEVPPLWIAPLWGLATAAMVRLAKLIRDSLASGEKEVE